MSISDNSNLADHPLFGNRKRVLAVPEVATKNNRDKVGKKVVTGVALALLLVVAFGVGLWAKNPAGGIGGALAAWPGQVWQQFLQDRLGDRLGSGLAGQSTWGMARVGGIMAYLMSFGSVVLGMAMSLRWAWVKTVLHPTATFYLHKILSLLTVAFLVLHLTGLALDNYTHISLFQSLIPFSTATYRPFWTGLGTLALYGTGLVILTAYLAKKLGYKVWRSVHYLTFGIFVMSLAHGVMTGSDTSGWWMQIIYIASGLLVTALTGLRFAGKAKPVRAAKASN
jgi:methionine sulfoxide reductase heme-binding subunit